MNEVQNEYVVSSWYNSIHDSKITNFEVKEEVIFSSSIDSTIRTWNSKKNIIYGSNSLEPISTFKIKENLMISGGGLNGTITIWDIEKHKHIQSFHFQENSSIKFIHFFEENKNEFLSVTSKDEINYWNLNQLKNCRTIQNDDESIISVSTFNNNKVMFTNSNGKVKLLNQLKLKEIFDLKKDLKLFSNYFDSNYLFYYSNVILFFFDYRFENGKEILLTNNYSFKKILHINENEMIFLNSLNQIELLDKRTFNFFIIFENDEEIIDIKYFNNDQILILSKNEIGQLFDFRMNKILKEFNKFEKPKEDELKIKKRLRNKQLNDVKITYQKNRIQYIQYLNNNQILIQYSKFDSKKYLNSEKGRDENDLLKGTTIYDIFEIYSILNLKEPIFKWNIERKFEKKGCCFEYLSNENQSTFDQLNEELKYLQNLNTTNLKCLILNSNEILIFHSKSINIYTKILNISKMKFYDLYFNFEQTLTSVKHHNNLIFFGFENGFIFIFSLKEKKFLREIQFLKNEKVNEFYFQQNIIFIKYQTKIIKIEGNDYKIFDKLLMNESNINLKNDKLILIDKLGSILFDKEIFKISDYPILRIFENSNDDDDDTKLSFKNWTSIDRNVDSFNLIDIKGNTFNFTSEKRIKKLKSKQTIFDFIRIGLNSFAIHFIKHNSENELNEIEKKLILKNDGNVK
eukprot:gene10447-2969_t